MTSNVGSQLITGSRTTDPDDSAYEAMKRQVLGALRLSPPEFLNRVDDHRVPRPLGADLERIVESCCASCRPPGVA